MNNNFDKKIEDTLKNLRNISLTDAERNAMFSRIDKYVVDHPKMTKTAPVRSPYFSSSFFFVHTKAFAFAAVVFIILGSTSAAAQYSLPGEILYGVKINVNEEVRALFAVGDYSKAQFESERAKERLKEASVLARNGRLSEVAKTEIQQNLSKHVAVVKNNVEKLRKEGNLNDALALGTNLEVTLRASENELTDISSAGAIADNSLDQNTEQPQSEDSEHISNLVLAVEDQIQQTSESRIVTEASISDSNNEQTIKTAAETKRDAALKILALLNERHKDDVKKDTGADSQEITITAKAVAPSVSSGPTQIGLMMAKSEIEPAKTEKEIIEEIKANVAQGEEFLKNEMYKEAFDIFNLAFELEATLQNSDDTNKVDFDKTPGVLPEVRGDETSIQQNTDDINAIHKKGFDKKREL